MCCGLFSRSSWGLWVFFVLPNAHCLYLHLLKGWDYPFWFHERSSFFSFCFQVWSFSFFIKGYVSIYSVLQTAKLSFSVFSSTVNLIFIFFLWGLRKTHSVPLTSRYPFSLLELWISHSILLRAKAFSICLTKGWHFISLSFQELGIFLSVILNVGHPPFAHPNTGGFTLYTIKDWDPLHTSEACRIPLYSLENCGYVFFCWVQVFFFLLSENWGPHIFSPWDGFLPTWFSWELHFLPLCPVKTEVSPYVSLGIELFTIWFLKGEVSPLYSSKNECSFICLPKV